MQVPESNHSFHFVKNVCRDTLDHRSMMASPGNLLKTQILRLPPTESESAL